MGALLLATALLAQAPDQVVGAADAEVKRPYKIGGNVQYRGLFVYDDTRRNDQSFLYRLKGRYHLPFDLPVPVDLRLDVGATQKFVAEEGESGWKLHDTQLFAHTAHDLDLVRFGLPRPITWQHWAGFYLPTSRDSLNQDLIMAPTALTEARYEVLPQLSVGFDGNFQYRWNRYAERAGRQGGMNTQWTFGGALVAEYSLGLPQPLFGDLLFGGDVWTDYQRHYASRESYESEASSQAVWQQDTGWDLYVGWAPLPTVIAVLSVEQGSPVLRNGIVNPQVLHRDETEIVATVEVWY